jgi:flagellar protein FliO/FliZ
MDSSALVLGLRVVLALAVVLGLLWWLARRAGGGKPRAKVTTVSVVGRQSLGRRSGVAVVEVEGRRLLLGVTDQAISLLTELAVAPVAEPAAERVEIDP